MLMESHSGADPRGSMAARERVGVALGVTERGAHSVLIFCSRAHVAAAVAALPGPPHLPPESTASLSAHKNQSSIGTNSN